MTAFVGSRRHIHAEYGNHDPFPDSVRDRRYHHRDHHRDIRNDVYPGRDNSRRWRQRQGFPEPSLGNDLLDDREAKLSKLQRHLSEMKEDNRQMSLRLSQAEDFLQELEEDDTVLPRQQELLDDLDPVTRGNWNDDDRERRLRRELREIRGDLAAMRESLQRHDSVPLYPLSQTLHHVDDGYHGERELSEWGARQLEGITLMSPTRHRSDLDGYGRRSPLPSGSLTRSASCVGYRSVIPRPLATQHNKFHRSPSSPRRLHQDYRTDDRVFVPSSPADLSIGDRVKVSRQAGTSASHGRIKYVGHLPGKLGPYVGLELENEGGKHDGTYNGFRYFQSKGYRGIFVPFDRITLAWRQ